MVGRLLGLRVVLAGVGEDVGAARGGLDMNLRHVLRHQVVFLHDVQHGRDRLVSQGLGGKCFVGAIGDDEPLTVSHPRSSRMREIKVPSLLRLTITAMGLRRAKNASPGKNR